MQANAAQPTSSSIATSSRTALGAWLTGEHLACNGARSAELFNNSKLCDVRLILGPDKEIICCHKVVLATHSAYFKRKFCDANCPASFLIISELTAETKAPFLLMLSYMYGKQITITAQNIEILDVLAAKFEVPSLNAQIRAFLRRKINQQNALKMLLLLNWTDYYDEITRACLCIIRHNPLRYFRDRDFPGISRTVLERLVRAQHINCSVTDLEDAINVWADSNPCSPEAVEQLLDVAYSVQRSPNCSRYAMSTSAPYVPMGAVGDFCFSVNYPHLFTLCGLEVELKCAAPTVTATIVIYENGTLVFNQERRAHLRDVGDYQSMAVFFEPVEIKQYLRYRITIRVDAPANLFETKETIGHTPFYLSSVNRSMPPGATAEMTIYPTPVGNFPVGIAAFYHLYTLYEADNAYNFHAPTLVIP